jgi:hypothetical protein
MDLSVGFVCDFIKKNHDSPQLSEALQIVAQSLGIEFIQLLLDVETRRNSTYDMLILFICMKPAIIELCCRV